MIIKYNEITNSLNIFEKIFIQREDIEDLELYKTDKEIDNIFSKILINILTQTLDVTIDYDIASLISCDNPNLKSIVSKRYLALKKYINDDIIAAEQILKEITSSFPPEKDLLWLKRNILIDIRNLNQMKIFFGIKPDEIISNEIEELDNYNYIPHLYSQINSSLNHYLSEDFDESTASPYSHRYSSAIKTSIIDLNKAFATSIIIGSITFISICRNNIFSILYQFGKLYNDPVIIERAFYSLLISGNVDTLNKVLNSISDTIYPIIVDTIMDVINTPLKFTSKIQNHNTKLILIASFANYIPDSKVKDIIDYVLDKMDGQFSMSTSRDLKRNAIKALKNLINRYKIDNLDIILAKLVNNNSLIIDEVTKLLTTINWENYQNDTVLKILNILDEKKESIHIDGDYFSVIAKLLTTHPELLKEKIINFYKSPSNEHIPTGIIYLVSTDKNSIIDLSIKKDLLKIIIKSIEQSNIDISNSNSVSFGGYSDFWLINNLLINNADLQLDEIQTSIVIQILANKNQYFHIKNECLEVLINILQNNGDNQLINFNNLIKDIKIDDLLTFRIIGFGVENRQNNTTILNFKFQNILVFYKNSISFSNFIKISTDISITTREQIFCGFDIIINNFDKSNINLFRELMYTLTFDKYYLIRGNAIYYLSKIINCDIEWENIFYNRVFELLTDNNHYVRKSILISLENILITEQYKLIINKLLRDPHFIVRKEAEKIFKKCNENQADNFTEYK